LTPAGMQAGDEGIAVAVTLSRSGRFADPFEGLPTGPTAHLPPLYPLETSYIYRMFGYGKTAAGIRNGICIAGLGLLYASFPAATWALGLAAEPGAIAGALAAIYPAFRAGEVFRGRDEWAAAALMLWLTVLIYRMCTRAKARLVDTLLFGLGWGLLLHMQPSLVIVLPLHALILLLYRSPIPVRRRLAQMATAGAIAILMLVPWTIRNHSVLGAWIFMRDNLGLEMAVSNGDGAQPSQQDNWHSGWYCAVHPSCHAAAADEIRHVGEVEYNRRRLHEAAGWIQRHPRRAGMLTLARAFEFWADIPSNRSTFVVRSLWSLFAWIGMAVMWRANYRLQARLLGSALVFYPLIYYLIQYTNRYVMPICFAIFLPAGFALHQAYLAWRGRAVPLPPAPL